MLYQISFLLNISSREAALALLEHSQQYVAVSQEADLLPSLFINRDNSYTLQADLRMPNAQDRDRLYDYITTLASSESLLGYLKKHNCGHDAGGECSEAAGEVWEDV